MKIVLGTAGVLRRLSLRQKFQSIIMLAVVAALVMACAAHLAHDVVSVRGWMKHNLELLAQTIGENSSVPLTLGDRETIQEYLQGLSAQPSIVRACLYGNDGLAVATYQRRGAAAVPVPLDPGEYRTDFENGRLILWHSVNLDGQPAGSIYMESDLGDMWQQIVQSLWIMLLVLTLAGGLSFLLAAKVQTVISEPVIHLAQTAKAITLLKNYEIRARKSTGDELGMLIDSFNGMLSEIERRDRELERYQSTLEEEVRTHTSELRKVNAQLTEARDRAEEASRAKTEFLGRLSHEIRTPMNGIIGMTGLALEGELTPPQRRNLLTVRSSADYLMTILTDVLDFSDMEAGKVKLDEVGFNLPGCLDETIRTLALGAHRKGIDLHCEIQPGLPESVMGDPIRLRQILLNVAGNAIKFTEKGEVAVQVLGDSAEQGSIELAFSVRDTGVGISPERQRTIFEAFSQGGELMTRRMGGIGMGLAISSRLAAMMGGTMSMESRPGEGSCFRFSVRLKTNGQVPEASRAHENGHPSLRVLLAEDDEVCQEIVISVLEKRGHTVVVAADGVDTLVALAQNRFDVVLMDLQMPELSGLEVAGKIRRAERGSGRHLPILALTAHATPTARESCLDCGMDGYLAKPVHPQRLVEAIESLTTVPR